MLTMEEAVLGRNVRPSSVYARWTGPDTYACFTDRKWQNFDVKSGEASEYVAATLPAGIPEDAANLTESPDGNFAYTLGKSLYIFSDSPVCVAESENDEITYGQTVSRNEFGISGGIFWSPKGSRLAFYRKDESRVTSFPLLDITTRTGSLVEIKYPMNGMESERISVGIYSLADSSTVWCEVDDFGDDRYLTNISWTPDEEHLLIQVLDRTQKHVRMNMYKASDGSFERTVLTEDNERFVEPLDPVHFLEGTYSFIYRTDNRDGFRNLYLCDTLGTVRRLTKWMPMSPMPATTADTCTTLPPKFLR